MANAYDLVSYFKNKKPFVGNNEFQTTFNGITARFSSDENMQIFKDNPKKYMPQFGGYCAYAIAIRKERKEIGAATYEIRDGKLYFFYNKWFVNKLESWLEEDTAKLQKLATKNWEELKN